MNFSHSDITNSENECIVCHKIGKYTCPSCGAKYCSKECFSKHSNFCVNQFAKRKINEISKNSKKVSTESIIRMQKTLENEDKDIIPFEVEPWKAWWESNFIERAPHPLIEPPEKVSPLLPYHLCDILYSYCYLMRLYNGDVSFDIQGAAECLLSISNVLVGKPEIRSVKQAISECISNTRRPDLFIEFQWQVEVVKDVEKVLKTNDHLCRALSETNALLREAKKKRAESKSLFFFAWAPTVSKKELEALQNEVHDYYTSLNAYLIDVHAKEAE